MSPAPITQSASPDPEPVIEEPGLVEEVGTETPDDEATESDGEASEAVTREADPVTETEVDETKRTLVHQSSPEEDARDWAIGDVVSGADLGLSVEGDESFVVIEHDHAARRVTLQAQ